MRLRGGTTRECADDSRFLNVLLRGHPAQPDRFGEYAFVNTPGFYAKCDAIRKGWEACGINLRKCGSGQYVNKYYYKGKPVTQEVAREIAMKNIGVHLQESDWKW